MILLDDHKRTLKPMSPQEFDRRFAAAAADPTENGLHLMKALLDTPVEAPSDHDTSRLPVGTPSGRVGANPFTTGTPSVGTPSVRSFVLALVGGTDPMTRVEYDTTLGGLVKATESRIRAGMPTASAFTWTGSVTTGHWWITVLDGSRGSLAEYDLKMTEEVVL